MFPRLTALLATFPASLGDWPRMLRGYALAAGEGAAVDLAARVKDWSEFNVGRFEHERLKWGPGAKAEAEAVAEGLPPAGAAYHWVGVKVGAWNTKTRRHRVRAVAGECRAGEVPPAHATHWTTGVVWVRFPKGV